MSEREYPGPNISDSPCEIRLKGGTPKRGASLNLMFVARVDPGIIYLLSHIVRYIIKTCEQRGISIFILLDENLKDNSSFEYDAVQKDLGQSIERVKFWSVTKEEWRKDIPEIKFIVSLGGDGTILYAAKIFNNILPPPIIPINFGTLGFLATFDISNLYGLINDIINDDMGRYLLERRSRLSCRLSCKSRSSQHESTTKEESCGNTTNNGYAKGDIRETSSQSVFEKRDNFPDAQHHDVLNDMVISRSRTTIPIQVILYIENKITTEMQADGLIISTPTGSTAYSLSAGGSLVHPGAPVTLITPISPHSLSSRPIVIPYSSELKVEVPIDTRSPVDVCFDGRSRTTLMGGESVVVKKSEFDVTFFAPTDPKAMWFDRLKKSFLWNKRTINRSPSPIDTYSHIIRNFEIN